MIEQGLVSAYIDYCRHVSRRSMAISIETASFVFRLCKERRPGRVCDLGSGFTSYMLRRCCTDVTSVDDSPLWLDRTALFLRRHHLCTDGLVDWKDWQGQPVRYDVIVHDFARGDLRNSSMTAAAERLAPGGTLVFDDAQHDGHRAEMERVAEVFGLQLVDIRAETLDAVNRYAAMAVAA